MRGSRRLRCSPLPPSCPSTTRSPALSLSPCGRQHAGFGRVVCCALDARRIGARRLVHRFRLGCGGICPYRWTGAILAVCRRLWHCRAGGVHLPALLAFWIARQRGATRLLDAGTGGCDRRLDGLVTRRVLRCRIDIAGCAAAGQYRAGREIPARHRRRRRACVVRRATVASRKASLVVAPETAIPLLPQDLPPEGYWPALRQRFEAGQQAVIAGYSSARRLQGGYTNSVVAIKPGAPSATDAGLPV